MHSGVVVQIGVMQHFGTGGLASLKPIVCEASASSHKGASAEEEVRRGRRRGRGDGVKRGKERGWGWRLRLPRGGPGV